MNKNKLKILMVCQHYYPERFQIQDICEQMVQDGHEVTALVGLPNYETGRVLKKYKHGKNRKETINGVQVFRTFEIGRRKGVFWRMLNYFSYTLSSSWYAFWHRKKYDIVFSYQLSPVFMLLPAAIIAKKQHIPLYVYCLDLWPESVKAMPPGDKAIIFKPIHYLSRYLYKKADEISVQSKSFFEYFEKVNNIPKQKLSYIPQMASSEYLDMDFTSDNGIIDLVFLGNIGNAQDIEIIINAAEKNKDLKNFAVHFIGDGIFLKKAKQLVKNKGLENIISFYGRKPLEEMPQYYKLADVCLVTLKGGSIISKTIPAKVQGYMAAGIPILAALDGFGAEVINKSGAGICVPTGDLEKFSAAMRDFILNYKNYSSCSTKAREYFKQNFTKRKMVDSLESKLQNLIKTKGEIK